MLKSRAGYFVQGENEGENVTISCDIHEVGLLDSPFFPFPL